MTASKNVAVIGAGALGRRHCQGVVKANVPMDLFVVDPFPASLEAARQAIAETGSAHPATRVVYCASVSELPKALDFVIVSTSSDTRYRALTELFGHAEVGALLLEKILFNDLDDYARAQTLIGGLAGRVWVNTARRVMAPHLEIKSFFENDPIALLSVFGGMWGLGTSAIHLVDLLDFLQPGSLEHVSTSGLSPIVTDSKRPGFKDLSGTLSGKLGAARFSLTALPDVDSSMSITIIGKNRCCLLRESEGVAFLTDIRPDIPAKRLDFVLPFISQTTTGITEAALSGAPVGLPTFAQSMALHLPLLGALGQFLHEHIGTPPRQVPLT